MRMARYIPIATMIFICLLIIWVVTTGLRAEAQPGIPNNPPPTYTHVPQFYPGGEGQPTPFFEIVQQPEYWPTALPVFPVTGTWKPKAGYCLPYYDVKLGVNVRWCASGVKVISP